MKVVEINGGVVTSAPSDILVVDWDTIKEDDNAALDTLQEVAEAAIQLPQGPSRIGDAIEDLITFIQENTDA